MRTSSFIVSFLLIFAMVFSMAAPAHATLGDVVAYGQTSFYDFMYNTFGIGGDGSENFWTLLFAPEDGECDHVWVYNIDDYRYCQKCSIAFDAFFNEKYGGYTSDIQTQYGTTEFSSFGTILPTSFSWEGSKLSVLASTDSSVEFELTSGGTYVYFDAFWYFPTFSSGQYLVSIPKVGVCTCGSVHTYMGVSYNHYWLHYLNESETWVSYADFTDANDSYFEIGLVGGRAYRVKSSYRLKDVPAGYHKFSLSFAPNIQTKGYIVPPEPTSRPTSITGNYGIIRDDGRLSMIRQQTIVNEGDQTYYNPVTNTAHNMTGWTYDYSTRTYNVTAEDGSESIITYGDDNVIIQEGDQTYNVYYLAESTGTDSGGSGDDSGQDPGDDPGTGDHKHSYTDQITKDLGCTLPGVRTYTCSCGDSYTKTVPATGHDWAIGTQVNASYDPATGELLQPGYVIYSCSTCGQQYKDDSNTGPPSSGSGSSGEDSLFGKLGELLGTAGSGVLDLISSAIGKLLDGAIALLEMAFEKLGRVVEILLSLFDAVPQLFGGYLDMFGAVFAFIPEDIITLLTFGVACVIILGVWKMIRR